MVKLWAVIYTLAVTAGAVVVQGASLTARESCVPSGSDYGHLKCETSGGSPIVSDCQAAIDALHDDDICYQSNGSGSHCKTLVTRGTCKIDVCGRVDSQLNREPRGTVPSSRCKAYLRNLLHDCKSGIRVGGQIFPQQCNVHYPYEPIVDPDYKNSRRYRIQFSHSSLS